MNYPKVLSVLVLSLPLYACHANSRTASISMNLEGPCQGCTEQVSGQGYWQRSPSATRVSFRIPRADQDTTIHLEVTVSSKGNRLSYYERDGAQTTFLGEVGSFSAFGPERPQHGDRWRISFEAKNAQGRTISVKNALIEFRQRFSSYDGADIYISDSSDYDDYDDYDYDDYEGDTYSDSSGGCGGYEGDTWGDDDSVDDSWDTSDDSYDENGESIDSSDSYGDDYDSASGCETEGDTYESRRRSDQSKLYFASLGSFRLMWPLFLVGGFNRFFFRRRKKYD